MTFVYHEKQVSLLCGVHALNSLLQGPYFDEIQLSAYGLELDRREREMMMEGGVESADFLKYVAEDSGNVASDGNFSFQVLALALASRNMTANRLNSTDVEAVRVAENPLNERAFICNLDQHWFTIVKIDGSWWNCNSLSPAPEYVTDTYLHALLTQLRMEGFTIFFVRCASEWPSNMMYRAETPRGKWWTREAAAAATKAAAKARVEGRNRTALEQALERAKGGTITLKPAGPVGGRASSMDEFEDPDLAAALQASMTDRWAGSGGAGPSHAPVGAFPPAAAFAPWAAGGAGAGAGTTVSGDSTDAMFGDDILDSDEDPELAMALAASLQAAGAGPDAGAGKGKERASASAGAGASGAVTSATSGATSRAGPGSGASSGGGGGGGGAAGWPGNRQTSFEFEDELQRAIRASMQDAGPSGVQAPGAGGSSGVGSKRQASSSPVGREEEQAVSVPEEPEQGSADAYELAIRLPDGQRLQRRFRATTTVAELMAFCTARGANMARFRLAQQGVPGAPPERLDPAESLAGAGLPRRCALVCVPIA